MNTILNQIYLGHSLTESETYKLFKLIMTGKINDIQLSSILTAINIRGESENEIIGAVRACLKYSKSFPKQNYMFSDIVGTGGDSSNSINISTASAFVGATCGLKIVKHCNTSISSMTGSCDLLKEFNIDLHASCEKSQNMLNKLNICFLFAPKYHANFKYISLVRKTLKIRTLFNILGPLINPSKPPLSLVGVYSTKLMVPMANVLKKLNSYHAIVVHSDHTDEVTLHDSTNVTELKNNNIISYTLCPDDFGVKYYNKNAILGGTPKENYEIIKYVLKGKGPHAISETIAVNVALLLKLYGNENLKKNTKCALKIIQSGKVYEKIIALSKF
ncbi:Anthranilate phosphoribosyltransferase [Buchnera aphidicola (Schlechtendalia chinensis)]|uniref:Anthranilate phosphoribosyltransferase n=2 Tax=Buchnera aphidicola subsp. Schlechtendalia chinensis TaxID=118110 RepID=TRPD_BUCSC|nr:anthranilate phosphoribosyltransferase [Buchnera aphidicola]Q44602.1 RecName: Full=Anthranilate phosphoribosyltransferase [Buchnera aphidicola (Schlechtendalia chinensis)]AAA92794.1 phosphoribosyl anthranilate transferase [Buchnera aphidicola]ANF17045.1 Anthranilate phosphoribosyltransferase [Buchnera aphidicola (Schlechtendalia chinensis)]